VIPASRLRALFVVAALAVSAAAAGQAPRRGPQEVSAKEAAEKIGRGVMFGTGSSTPPNFIPLMREVALAREGRTNVFYMSTFASESNFRDEVVDKWHPNLFFVSQSNRAAATRAKEGMATLHRASLFQLGQRIEKGEFPIDTVVVRVSPPDKDGYVSLGTSSDLTMVAVQSVLKRGGQIIAEINPNVPHAYGNRIKYEDLSWVTRGNDLLSEATRIEPMGPEKAIAGHVAKLVPTRRRSTLQVGIGNAVAGVGEALLGKRLDIWSEMGSASVLKLVAGERPTARQAVFSFLHADNESYRVAHENPRIRIAPSTEVNDPAIIAQKKRMVAVNTALEVDLLGNVNAERDGERVISAPGGQPDFMEGAARAADGKAILALRSTAKDGISTVVTRLKGPTTTPHEHVDHVVTEFGATKRLRGKSDAFRAYQIISVANPLHRVELAHAALEAHLIDQKQADKLRRGVFPAIRRAPVELRAALANAALEKGLITPAEQEQVTRGLPAPAPAAGELLPLAPVIDPFAPLPLLGLPPLDLPPLDLPPLDLPPLPNQM
jgi:acyl-CoA hydrolase